MFMNYIGNPAMLDLMKQEDVDFHGEAAKIAFKVDKDHPEYKFYRQLAKTITFGVIYGIGRDKLAGQLNTSPKEAGKYKAEYFKNITGLRSSLILWFVWLSKEVGSRVSTTGYTK